MLQPVPLGPVSCVDVLAPNMVSVTRAVAWAHANAKQTNLSTCLQEKCPSLGDPGGAEPVKCLTGVSLCTGDVGKQAVFLGGRLLATMMATYAPSPGSRTLLHDGRIVLDFIGEPMVENRSFDEVVDLQDAYDTLILHVGLQNLKPFRTTFLVGVPGKTSPEVAAGAGRKYVQVQNSLIQRSRQS